MQDSQVRHGRWSKERGSALMVALTTLVALISIGGLALLSARSELQSVGQARFSKAGLYAAESGAAAAMEFFRSSCNPSGTFFSDYVEPANFDPQQPSGIPGNGQETGATFNPFTADARASYRVFILNNPQDPGFAAGDDLDGRIVLRSVGLGPNDTQVTIEVEIMAESCIATFCAIDYAQKNVSQRNDAVTVCSNRIDTAGNLRTISL